MPAEKARERKAGPQPRSRAGRPSQGRKTAPVAPPPDRAPLAQADRLAAYRAKRSAERTGEPFRSAVPRPRLFVVQKHSARRTHYDFRLECAGTLWSWAVPHGISFDPKEKRLAVHVEDHPVEYADFEGIIPEGNYGAGAVIVWDNGVWLPYDDPDEGIVSGKLHFELRGHKLRGVWTLVRLKQSEKDWLLIKKADAWAKSEDAPIPDESIFSGLTVEELRDGRTGADEIRARLVEVGAPRKPVDPFALELMLAQVAEAPFSSQDWIFEIKYDGYRLIAARRADGSPLLRSRGGGEVTATYPEVARGLRALPYPGLVMDGEVVVLDERGHPDFQLLQGRARLSRRADIERAAVERPATLFLFDLLGFDGFDLRKLPLLERKRLLRRVLPAVGPLAFADHVERRGGEMFEQARSLGLEGVIAKKAHGPYRAGRSGDWLKVVADKTDDFVICGYSSPRGSRSGFGALHLGAFEDGTLVYAGRVGTGFDHRMLAALRAKLDAIRRPSPPCTGNIPSPKDATWVAPKLVAEVRYKEWTDEGALRQPVFVRLRGDKAPEDCVRARGAPAPDPEPAPQAAAPERVQRFSNLSKIFWPEDGYSKGDLIEYYRAIGPWILPYLADRPVVLTRYPDGIHGKSFFQKNAPAFTPDWIRTERIWSEHAEREIDYLVCDSEEALLFLANLGTIPLHVWSSRIATLQQPDWTILDLDPKGAPFAHVVELALAVRALCEEIGLEPFIKTSGSTGLHVLIPLARQFTYEQSRMLAHLLARIVQEEHPEIATIARAIGARGGRVYLDFLQNRHGQLLVAPFSVRPLPGAPVSTPLEWREVNRKLDPQAFTLRTVPARLSRIGRDPLRPLLEQTPDLAGALAKLTERMERTKHRSTATKAPRARER